MYIFLLSYILQNCNVSLCARYHPSPPSISALHLLFAPGSWHHGLHKHAFYLTGEFSQYVYPVGSQNGEESEVRLFISLIPTSCEIYSGWLCPCTEGYPLFRRQLLCRSFFVQVNFSHLVTLWVLGWDAATAATLSFRINSCISCKLHLHLCIYSF